jgi:hypothetical protein
MAIAVLSAREEDSKSLTAMLQASYKGHKIV